MLSNLTNLLKGDQASVDGFTAKPVENTSHFDRSWMSSASTNYFHFVYLDVDSRNKTSFFNSRKNSDVNNFFELQGDIVKMTLLPVDHDFHLNKDVASKAAHILSWLQSNTTAEAPRVINEEGDAVIFTWDDGSVKKYLCVDDSEVEIETRRLGAQFVTSEVVEEVQGCERIFHVSRVLDALGVDLKSSAAS